MQCLSKELRHLPLLILRTKTDCLRAGKNTKVDLPWTKNSLKLIFFFFFILYILTSILLFFVDNDGPYYWHIKSGTIQREPPEDCKEISTIVQQFLKDTDDITTSTIINCVTRSNTSSALESIKDKKEDLAFK